MPSKRGNLSLLSVVSFHLMVTFSAADRLTLTRILKGKDHNKDHNEKVIITSTELCNEQQFSDFVEELGSCRFEAESIIDQELHVGFAGFERAICRSIDSQLKCIDKIAPKCHDNQSYNNIRLSQGKFQMAYNVSVLGKDFIDGCPVLSREEAGLVKFYADSNKCDYTVFEGRWRAFRSCVGYADDKMDAVLQLIESDVFTDTSAAYRKAQCDYAESLFFTCRKNTVDRCYSDAKIGETAAKTKGALQEREILLREQLPDFSYDLCDFARRES